MTIIDNNKCPICANRLIRDGRIYSVDELFDMWKPIVFSQTVTAQHKAQTESTQLHICRKCNLEIFLPQIIGLPNFYIELQKATLDSYYVEDKWDFEEALKDAKTAKSIIEIGCGPGAFLKNACQYVNQAVGIEYNMQALAIARNKGLNIYSFEDDISKLKGQFDAAFSFHVLEHVPDPLAFIQEMLEFVKPGGKIGISVPNMDGPIKYIDPCVSNMPPHHATRWKLKTFQVLVAKHGLVIERVAYEPLVVRDYYYYSTYWLRQSFLAKILPNYYLLILQKITSRFFDRLFEILARFNRKELGLLKGQSIYVLLSKQK